jgi:hypothetical protein
MGPLGWVEANLGLTVLSALATGLVAYLVRVMVHPEQF